MTTGKVREVREISPAPVPCVANAGWTLSAGGYCVRLSTSDGGEHPPRLEPLPQPLPQPLRQESLCQALLTPSAGYPVPSRQSRATHRPPFSRRCMGTLHDRRPCALGGSVEWPATMKI